ncbi:hypothetical protein WSM22_16710 [Cytophagales bacterium WSM2-2]|nr:hypothetical protein WSM22_16710 [Cytophagales bacterium WSM2-2]
MNAKLTLSLDQRVIESAKKESRKKGISLSKLIEDYLREITNSRNSKKGKGSATELIGIAGKVPDNFNYRDELFKILSDKHLK